MIAVSLAVEMLCPPSRRFVADRPTCSMRVRHPPLITSPSSIPQTHACKPGKPLQPARPEPANCRALPRWWGPPLAFTCLRACQCDATIPSSHPCSPTHPYSEILGNPASRAQTSTLTLATLYYLASLLCSSSLLPLQDDRE